MKKTLAVKEIATFLYSSGDLTNEFFSNRSNLEGQLAHKFLQRQYNDESEKEYYIKYKFNYKDEEITVHGYIDGVLNENEEIILEEIKSTHENLEKIDLDYHKEHLAQLRLYAYLYCKINDMSAIKMRLTYITVDTYKTKKFNLEESYDSLASFFNESIEKYLEWDKVLNDESNVKLDTIKNVNFPFKTKREGQQELMKATYLTMNSNGILYAIAPTGIGKTMATMFSTLKSFKKRNEKLFYLTAKTMGRTVAIDSIKLLMKSGLSLHSIVISSKAKSCLLGQSHCDPDKCPFAKGYFSHLRDALEDIYKNEKLYTYEIIRQYALKHKICAFEFSLDLSYFCDLIICDYNYVFDPKAHLIRYFEDSEYDSKILCDEAHNLVERSKDMYSAILDSNLPMFLEEKTSQYDSSITKIVKSFYNELKNYDKLINSDLFFYSHFLDDGIINYLRQLHQHVEVVLTDHKDIENRDEILNWYFSVKDFTDTAEFFSDDHLFIIKQIENNHYELNIKCADASEFIYKTIKYQTKGIVLFSATLFPIKYYMDLLTKGNGKYLNLKSPFPQDNLKLIIKDNVSTKYKDREQTLSDIALAISTLVNAKKGNYIVFFPSYKYLNMVLSILDVSNTEILVQRQDMTDIDREKILDKFKNTKKAHLGLFVLGGSFSEGVDFVGDLLNGVIVVGTGLPMISVENNLLKEFFDEKYGMGFDYAYTYPGFNKVVQAAGRVIRQEEDRGVVILIDDRYRQATYKALMPPHWNHYMTINGNMMLKNIIEEFYDEDDSMIN